VGCELSRRARRKRGSAGTALQNPRHGGAGT
jgi:hypothetical protein